MLSIRMLNGVSDQRIGNAAGPARASTILWAGTSRWTRLFGAKGRLSC
jgi:hypothetical protein